VEFLFVGSILLTPAIVDETQAFIFNRKLNGLPTYGNQKRLLIDAENKPDVIIQVGDRKFHAHKEVLARRSKVFEAMFNSYTKESETALISIEDFGEDVIEEMILFIYTDTCSRLEVLASELLAVADKYFIEKLKLICEIELIKIVNKDNMCELLCLADVYNAENLANIITKYIHAQTSKKLSTTMKLRLPKREVSKKETQNKEAPQKETFTGKL